MMQCNQICSLLSSVFYDTIDTLVIMVKDIAGLKRRQYVTVSQVALPSMVSDAKAGLKRRHRKLCLKLHFPQRLVTPRQD